MRIVSGNCDFMIGTLPLRHPEQFELQMNFFLPNILKRSKE